VTDQGETLVDLQERKIEPREFTMKGEFSGKGEVSKMGEGLQKEIERHSQEKEKPGNHKKEGLRIRGAARQESRVGKAARGLSSSKKKEGWYLGATKKGRGHHIRLEVRNQGNHQQKTKDINDLPQGPKRREYVYED